ncbi:hypothetical protein AX14_000575 [Amanita brunnescens Koide BX004]|nr:hypothetical protein AX14_000575 [Amanita brunnescens Koide BX004]
MQPLHLLACLAFVHLIISQEIWDIWQTTWDQSSLFEKLPLTSPIEFSAYGGISDAGIVINDSAIYQQIDGIGASCTDSSAFILNNLKGSNRNNYWELLNYMFNNKYTANSAGLSYIRIPIGASDFSQKLYSLDDVNGDMELSHFNIDNAPSCLFDLVSDILSINNRVKIHIVPWSPPGWMKNTSTMNGGNLLPQYYCVYPTYLLKAVQGFEAQLGKALRSLLDDNGLRNVKIVAYEHNWNNATTYPVEVLKLAPDAFSGAAFHCYSGTVSDQTAFHAIFPNKEVYFTECTGVFGSEWWNDVQWYMNNIFIGSLQNWARAALMWNLALDGSGNPKLPGTSSCGTGCRPVVTVNSDGGYSFNQEFWSMAQASKAIVPKDLGGPCGQRIGVTVAASLNKTFLVGAYVINSTDCNQYSLVVLNRGDNSNGTLSAQPVAGTIEFRGKQVNYTFPVGVTTLWWFAP